MPLRLYAFLHPSVCKKCLSAAIQTTYCAETPCNGYAIGRDHLHRTCSTCGYTWLEECLRYAYRLVPEHGRLNFWGGERKRNMISVAE